MNRYMFVLTLLVLHFNLHAKASTKRVDDVLTRFHQAASEANGDAYFALLHKDSIFIGTDAKERWSKQQFKGYALPIFNQGRGWTYHSRDRHIMFSADNKTAWFDEMLDHKKYGECRGTGVLVLTSDGWQIMQYHLTFPIPNEIVDELLDRIIAHKGDISVDTHP